MEVISATEISANHSPGKVKKSVVEDMSILEVSNIQFVCRGETNFVLIRMSYKKRIKLNCFTIYERTLHTLLLIGKHPRLDDLQEKRQERERHLRHYHLTSKKWRLQKY